MAPMTRLIALPPLLCAAACVAAACLAPMALAQSAQSDAESAATAPSATGPSEWSAEARQLSFGLDAGGFHFESERRSGLGDDAIEGRFDAATGILRYDLAARQPDNGAVLRLETEWLAVLEFRDVDASGTYTVGDEVVGRIPFFGAEATVVGQPLVGGGHQATVRYALPPPADPDRLPVDPVTGGGTLRLTFTVQPRPTQAGPAGALQAPATGVLHSTLLENYAFRQEGTLAGVEVRADADSLASNGFVVQSAWAPGQPRTVLAEPGGGHTAVLSGPRAQPVAGDGLVAADHPGVQTAGLPSATLDGRWGPYLLGGAAAAVAVAVPSWLRLRRG